MLKKICYQIMCIIALFYPCYAYADMRFVERPEVQSFIRHMVKKHHFNKAELVALFNAVKIKHKVIHHIRVPLEKKSWYIYQMAFITESRIRQGVEFWNRHAEILARAEKAYGVPASIIVATIGVETKYGKNVGNYRVMDALTNIAFSNSPRASYFRSELKEFLLLTRENHLNPLSIMGSYAGAFGLPQFMPSSYRYYAVSHAGKDQRVDLSHNVNDAVLSVANYYEKHGWKKNHLVAIPTSYSHSKFHFFSSKDKELKVSPATLIKYGISQNDKSYKNQKTKLIELPGFYNNEYWLGYHNFDVIKKYNASDLYAMAVYQLSYYVDTLRKKRNHEKT